MRIVVVFTLLILLQPAVTHAQARPEPDNSHKVTKVIVGASLLTVGAIVAAKSGQSTTTSSALGTSENSSFSSTQLITGLVIAGTGGIVLWDGLRDHGPASPSTTLGVGLLRRAGAQVFFRRRW